MAAGLVYFGDYDSYIYCLNGTIGTLLWRTPTGNAITGSPIVAGGYVYIGSEDYHFYCLNCSTGNIIWNYAVGNKIYSSAAYSRWLRLCRMC